MTAYKQSFTGIIKLSSTNKKLVVALKLWTILVLVSSFKKKEIFYSLVLKTKQK